MNEQHENEQYFWDAATLTKLTEFLEPYAPVCCLCAPVLGRQLVEAGIQATILDTDERFSDIPGFVPYDIRRPTWLGTQFGLIICDPPFYNVSLSRLFKAIRTLSLNDFRTRLMLCYLKRRESAVLSSFSKFELHPSGYFPGYETVDTSDRNEIEFFTNLRSEECDPLQNPQDKSAFDG